LDYQGEIPRRIHASHHGQHYGLGAAPPFAPEFERWMDRLHCGDPRCKHCGEDLPVYIEGHQYREKKRDERVRVTRAFRKLRRAAPLEFDVLYMAVMGGHTIAEIAEKLTERAISKNKPERYDSHAVTVLVVLGVDKVSAWV
jgi:hypothetical protein